MIRRPSLDEEGGKLLTTLAPGGSSLYFHSGIRAFQDSLNRLTNILPQLGRMFYGKATEMRAIEKIRKAAL